MELAAALLSSQSSPIKILSIYCEIPDARDCVFSLSLSLCSPAQSLDVKQLLEEGTRRTTTKKKKQEKKAGGRRERGVSVVRCIDRYMHRSDVIETETDRRN